MSKKPLGKGADSKTTQADIPVDTQKEDIDQLIETAAEQLADLLLKCWQASNTTRRGKRTKSGSRADRLGSP